MISKRTIEKVFETARVEEVIGDFVQLKKSGSNYKGLSPFTEERTPSFMVSPAKQIWKDFSSGKGGTVITFLMEHEKYSYPEAIKYIANKYNIEVEETERTQEQISQDNEKESLFLVSDFAKNYFIKNLFEEEGKTVALSYLKERNFNDEIIQKFEIGYSVNVKDNFSKAAIRAGYKLNFLEKTGLTIVKENENIDRFRGRVVFPIRSMSGRILGFGGRILGSSKNIAKYINSPESLIYQKSKVLYGIFESKQSIVKNDNCFLVEGYTDVIKMHQCGISNVVSSSGTALTENQIRLINRLTKNITVVFDGDAAGSRAALRGIDLILEQGMNVKICNLPEGDDPDSFVSNKNLEEVQSYLNKNTKDFIVYKASLLLDNSENDPVKKAAVIRDMVESISKISDYIKRELYIKECSSIMNISEQVLYSTLAQIVKKDFNNLKKKPVKEFEPISIVKSDKKKRQVNELYELERKIIEILILYGNDLIDFEEEVFTQSNDGGLTRKKSMRSLKVFEKIYMDLHIDEMEFSNDNFKNIYFRIIECFNENKEINIDKFINELSVEQQLEVTNIVMDNEKYFLHDWEKNNIYPKTKKDTLAQLTIETVLNLRCFLIDKKVNGFRDEVKENQLDKDNLEEVINYSKLKKLLSEKLNRVL
ncbi:MAG: DNA primase [Flavobacteriaceae bacterium]|nr:DNA primase [Flavobacteriaceae bacterium]OUV86295.1 MAG: DNA primase [Flavobacteriaceae bacterium TMED145]